MSAINTVEIAGLNQLIYELNDALIGYGDDGDLRKIMREQAGLLAHEISVKLGPKTQAAGMTKLDKEIGKAFAEITVPVFPQAKRGNGKGPLEFLFATSKKVNYLVGVDGASTVTSRMSAAELARQSRRNRGVKWQEVGRRGKQFVIKLNRYIVQAGRKAQLAKLLKNRIGRMRATFAYAAHTLGRKGTPAWVSRHFSAVRSEGKAIFDMSKLKDKGAPIIEFGSRAPGIGNFDLVINDAVATRSMKVAARIRRVIGAYARQQRGGQPITSGYQPGP